MKNEKFRENENILKILSMLLNVFISTKKPYYKWFDPINK